MNRTHVGFVLHHRSIAIVFSSFSWSECENMCAFKTRISLAMHSRAEIQFTFAMSISCWISFLCGPLILMNWKIRECSVKKWRYRPVGISVLKKLRYKSFGSPMTYSNIFKRGQKNSPEDFLQNSFFLLSQKIELRSFSKLNPKFALLKYAIFEWSKIVQLIVHSFIHLLLALFVVMKIGFVQLWSSFKQ